MYKIGLICYHKNVETLYPKRWIEEFKSSIDNQTYKGFIIYELEYGNGSYRIFDNSVYESMELPTFVHAMNYLLDKAFADGCFAVFNSNCDDAYTLDRIDKQMFYMRNGWDLVSSNFMLVENDRPVLLQKFDKLNIREELAHNHNILCHPAMAYSKRFWQHHRYIPEQVPLEDMKLWQRAVESGMKIKIHRDVLCYHRIHNNSVCKNPQNR